MGNSIWSSVNHDPLVVDIDILNFTLWTSGAMGCGAYRCPPKLVAEEMKSALLDPEFKGWFRGVVFAVYSNQRNGAGNFDIFQSIFNGVNV